MYRVCLDTKQIANCIAFTTTTTQWLLTKIYIAKRAAAYPSAKPIFPTNSKLHLQGENEILNTGNDTHKTWAYWIYFFE